MISFQCIKEVKAKYASLLLKAEDFWRQRIKYFWLLESDLNSRFFHCVASARKKKQTRLFDCKMLMGVWCGQDM